jgi:hypothetical protein
VVPTKSFATVGGIIEINLLALTNTATRQKQVIAAEIPRMAAYGPCVRVGEFLLPSGLMPIGHDGNVVGKTVSPDLPLFHTPGTPRRRRFTITPRRCAGSPGRRWATCSALRVFRLRFDGLSRYRHGLVGETWRATAPVRLPEIPVNKSQRIFQKIVAERVGSRT